jgi:hypothetical protein
MLGAKLHVISVKEQVAVFETGLADAAEKVQAKLD